MNTHTTRFIALFIANLTLVSLNLFAAEKQFAPKNLTLINKTDFLLHVRPIQFTHNYDISPSGEQMFCLHTGENKIDTSQFYISVPQLCIDKDKPRLVTYPAGKMPITIESDNWKLHLFYGTNKEFLMTISR